MLMLRRRSTPKQVGRHRSPTWITTPLEATALADKSAIQLLFKNASQKIWKPLRSEFAS